MNGKTQKWCLESLLIALVVNVVVAMPTAYRKENYQRDKTLSFLDHDVESDVENADFQKALHRFLHNNEHKEVRKMLTLAIRVLDNEEDNSRKEALLEQNMDTLQMPFYFEHIKSLVNGEISKNTRRRHKKRSTFDSISHNGGLSGLGGTHTRRKLEFTFENLLPYLIREMRRNNREIPDTDY